MNEQVVFALLLELWRDLQDPAFLWQVFALGLSVLLAWGLSRYGERQEFAQASADYGALRAFSTGSLKRVAFPLLSLLFVVIVRKAFKYWQLGPVSLLDLAVPLLLSMALVRAAIYVLRHAFSPSSWLASSERFIATSIWLCLALYITGLAAPLMEMLEQVSFHAGSQRLDLWTLLTGLVTVVVTVLAALWLSGEIEGRVLANESLDSNLRVVLGRLVKAVLSVIALLLGLSMVGIDITALSVFSGRSPSASDSVCRRLPATTSVASSFCSTVRSALVTWCRLTQRPPVSSPRSLPRYTVLRTLTGTEVIIPNEYLVSNIVRNESFTRFTRARGGIGAGGLRHRSRTSHAPDERGGAGAGASAGRPRAAGTVGGFCRERHQSRSWLLDR
jgi:hypothetical protein